MRACLLAALLLPGTLTAADPTVEVRIKAINDLLPAAEYLGALAGQEEQAKQFTGLVKAFTNKKGLEGIDPKRPIGAYARFTPNMIDSPVVLMLPLADEEAFLNLLKNRLSLTPEKGDNGVYEVKVPNVPPPVFFKFHNGYICGTVLNKAALDETNLLDPKAFFAKPDDAVLSIALHMDRLPSEVRKSILGQMELKFADAKKANVGKPKMEKLGNDLGLDIGFKSAVSLLEDGRTAALRLRVEPKTDDLSFDFTLTAKDGTDLHSRLASAGRRPSATAAAVGPDAMAAVSANFALPDWAKARANELLGVAMADALDKANGEQRMVMEKLYEAFEPTLKAGVVDLAIGLTGTGKDHRLAAAVAMTEGMKVEDLAKEFAPHLPADKGTLTLDVAKSGAGTLHKLAVTEPQVEALFGSGNFWLVTDPARLVLTAEPDGNAVRAVAGAKAKSAPLFRAEVATTRVMALAEKGLTQDELAAIEKDVFEGPAAGKDGVRFAVNGGESLSVSLSAKGRAVKFLAAIDQKKKAK